MTHAEMGMGAKDWFSRPGDSVLSAMRHKTTITLHQLLVHTAGFSHDVIPRDDLVDRDTAVAQILAAPLQTKPGLRNSYSNAGYTLLAAIIERASGQTFESFLRESLWLPLGMRHTGNLLPDWSDAQFALGYWPAGSSPTPPKHWWIADGPSWSGRGAGYILSTPGDMIRWGEALQSGHGLSAISRRKMFFPHVKEGDSSTLFYGYGVGISIAPSGDCVIEHDGGAGFHYSVLMLFPDHRASAFLFTTEYRGPSSAQMDSARGLLKGRQTKVPLPLAMPVQAEKPSVQWRVSDRSFVRLVSTGGRMSILSREPDMLRLFSAFSPLVPEDAAVALQTSRYIPKLFETLRAGDYDLLAELLDSEAALSEEKEFWPRQWRLWERDMGKFISAESFGHRRTADQFKSYVRLQFARSALPIQILHRKNGIFIDTVTIDFPERFSVVRSKAGQVLTYNSRLGTGVKILVWTAATVRISNPASLLRNAASECIVRKTDVTSNSVTPGARCC